MGADDDGDWGSPEDILLRSKKQGDLSNSLVLLGVTPLSILEQAKIDISPSKLLTPFLFLKNWASSTWGLKGFLDLCVEQILFQNAEIISVWLLDTPQLKTLLITGGFGN